MEGNTTPQNEDQSTADQPQSASEQVAQSPEVATSGAPSPTDGAPGTVENNEYEAEQREHLERRTEPQLPDPNENAATQGSAPQSDAEAPPTADERAQQGLDQPQQ